MLLPWRDMSPAPFSTPKISTSITEREAARLADLAAGKQVLEVGSAYGFSAITMALAGATVTAVDPHAWLQSFGPMLANLADYRLSPSQVAVVQQTSYDALPRFTAEGRAFDLIFVDGDHVEAAVEHDVTWARKLLAPGGILACHDWDEDTCPGVRMALERVLGQPDELADTLAIYKALA